MIKHISATKLLLVVISLLFAIVILVSGLSGAYGIAVVVGMVGVAIFLMASAIALG